MNLKNLETRLYDALNNETKESLTRWLGAKRDEELEQLANKHTAIFSDWQGQESHVRKLAFKIGYQIAKENITKEITMAQQTMAQEKAVKLFKKYYCLSNNSKSKLKVIEYETAKQCALIAVDEVKKCTKYEKQTFENDRFSEDYWTLVEQEINKL